MMNKVTFELPEKGYKGKTKARDFEWILDEPESMGGTNEGPTPTEMMKAALAGCIGITLRMYAERKEWETGEIKVEVYTSINSHKQTKFHKSIKFGNEKNLTQEQLDRLYEISSNCPVSKLLQQAVPVVLD